MEDGKALRGADIVARSLARLGANPRVHALGQSHHVDLRCRDRGEARSRACAPRGGRRAHGGCVGPAHRRGRHRDGDRRTGPRQRGRRALHGAGRGIPDGAALRPRRHMGAWPRRLSGNPPGRHGGAGFEGVVDRNVGREPRARYRRSHPHCDIRPAGTGASEPAVGSAGGARREQRDRLAGCARVVRARIARIGRGRRARRDRVGGAADHLRAAAAVQRQRPRAAGKARSRDAGACRDPRKPARHRGCDARRILRPRARAPT